MGAGSAEQTEANGVGRLKPMFAALETPTTNDGRTDDVEREHARDGECGCCQILQCDDGVLA